MLGRRMGTQPQMREERLRALKYEQWEARKLYRSDSVDWLSCPQSPWTSPKYSNAALCRNENTCTRRYGGFVPK